MNSDGGVEKIDLERVDWRGSREFFESLGDALDKLDDHDESYDFTWVGKRKSIIEAGAPINKTLRPDVENSKNWDTTENLFIEGDNLDALKLLQESYLGKVKMIYIDPPYNTGKDFVYHDNFRADTEQYDEDTEYKDDEGNIQFKKNEKTNGRYHSDWLSMMYPRLKLARNLLSDDGVMFISIDDNEQANLKKLCDEVFGEDNQVGVFVWKSKPQGGNDNANIVTEHEYVVCYSRNKERLSLRGRSYNPDKYRLKDSYFNERGGYVLAKLDLSTLEYRANLDYAIEAPDGTEIYAGSVGAQEHERRAKQNTKSTRDWQWRWSKERFLMAKSAGFIEIKKNANDAWGVYAKEYEKVDKDGNEIARQLKYRTIIDDITTVDGTKEIESLVGKRIFSFPKPTKFIDRFLEMATDEDSLAVDFFSGSGTLAHSVLKLNARDGGRRKFIVVQYPEDTPEISEARSAGYKTIPEISRDRIRRAGDKIASEHPDAKVDYGFRALRIDDTNHKDVYRPAADVQQSMLDDLVDNIKPDRSDLDLLYGVLTQSALELNRPIVTDEIDGATVYRYDYFAEVSGLVACFAPTISEATIKQIAQLRPLTAVFRESSFPDSQAKVNLAEHFRIISPDTKVKVV